jgi:predicted transcriptional regulator
MTQPVQQFTESEKFSDIGFLARSRTRVDILEELREEDVSAPALRERLDLPRTTLRRNLVELEERNWVIERTGENEFSITPAGELALEAFSQVATDVETANAVGSFLEHLPTTPPGDHDEFRACSITCSTSHSPHAPVSRVGTLVAESSRVELIVPIVSPLYVEMLTDRELVADSIRVTTSAETVDRVRRQHPEQYEAFTDSPGWELHAVEETPAFAVGRADEVRLAGTFTDDMRVDTVLEAPPDTTLAAWIDQQYSAWMEEVDRDE